ncbi:uncharacterized protein si:ch211-272n13.3 [Megalops cyprinoides]|uniref:uncharacterized protein si:ch211-272n13.3 n=1 Tax=Megalops cyprinoides TaxID=118141 RepID=UPI0018650128|nr:uncharacterized protein si:ch211-272n13.3 [Megalops cyprinoides]
MKKIFSFAKKKKGFSPNSSDTGSVLSAGYEIKEKDLGKLHKAAAAGDLAKLKQLAKKNDLSQLDKDNRTPLHIACANGHVEVVQFLVENKAKLNLCDNQNRSPLMKAVQCQQESCAATLLEHDADPSLVDINGNTALHLAALIPSISLAVQLLEHEANINAQNKDGCTPLTLAVTENHAEMVEFLLKEGADVNARDQGERTSLMIAACNGQISMVRLLLRYDADITVKDEKGWTSDDYAVMNGHHACSHLIIEHGTKRKSQSSPSHLAPGKKKRAAMLGSPGPGVETGPALGGPAMDREVEEDDSQAESLSRASKGGAGDSWPSSDEDDELDFSPKKPQKPNLKKLMSASHKGKSNVVADVDKSWSDGQSEQESEGGAKRTPLLPTALPPAATSPHPASPPPTSRPPKPPLATSTPPSSFRKDDEEEDDEDEEDENEDEEEDEEQDEEEEGEGPEEGDIAVACVGVKAVTDGEMPDTGMAEMAVAGIDGDAEKEAYSEWPSGEGQAPAEAAEQGIVGKRSRAESQNEEDGKEDIPAEYQPGQASGRISAIMDLGEDYVVSAIRVESRFSDEEESDGKEVALDHNDEPKTTPLRSVGAKLLGKKAEEPPSPDVSWGDENDDEKMSDHDDVLGTGSPELTKPKTPLKQQAAEALLDDVRSMSPDDSWGSGKDDAVLDHRREVSGSGSPEKPEPLPRQCGPAKLLGKKVEEPLSPDVSWGDERDESDSDSNDHAAESPPAKESTSPLVLGKTPDKLESPDDSWSSGEGDVKSKPSQPARNVAEQEDSDVPVSLIVGHYEGSYNGGEDSGKDVKELDEEVLEKVDFSDEDKEKTEDLDSQVQQLKYGTVAVPKEKRGAERSLEGPPVIEQDVAVHGDKVEPWDSEPGGETSHGNTEGEPHPGGKAQPIQTAVKDSKKKWGKFQEILWKFERNVAAPLRRDSEEDSDSEVTKWKDGVDPASSKVTADPEMQEEGDVAKDVLRAGSPHVSVEKQSESDIDWGEELSNKEELPQTVIDDVDLNPPREEKPPHMEEGAKKSRDIGDKQLPGLKALKPRASKEEEEEDDDEEAKEEEGEEEDGGDADDLPQKQKGSHSVAEAPALKSQAPKDVKRDFLSELGLEGGEEEESPWDSESGSDSPGKRQNVGPSPVKTHKAMASISEENSEDLFYVPSFLRGSRNFRMANLESPRSVVQAGSRTALDSRTSGVEKKLEVLKPQPASVPARSAGPKPGAEKKSDLMEELGLDDADDLEDASDWDSASTASRTVPARKPASPREEELSQSSPEPAPPSATTPAPAPEKRPPSSPTPTLPLPLPLPSPRSLTPRSSLQLQPQPQPRARKLQPVKGESEEESDWDSESVTPGSSPGKPGILQPNAPESKAISKQGTPPRQRSPQQDGGSDVSVDPEEEQHKEKNVFDTSELNVSSPYHIGTVDSETQANPEEIGGCVGGGAGKEQQEVTWDKRFEKIWVEIEKREVKSQFKSVAAELKEKFGETVPKESVLGAGRKEGEEEEEEEEEKEALVRTAEEGPGQNLGGASREEEQEEAVDRTAEEESSEEEEIVRPAARAKSAALLPIPEQRESGLEDSVTEPAESPRSEGKAEPRGDTPQNPVSAESSQQGELCPSGDSNINPQEKRHLPPQHGAGSHLDDDDTDFDGDYENCGGGNPKHDSESSTASENASGAGAILSTGRGITRREVEEEVKRPTLTEDLLRPPPASGPAPSQHANPSAPPRYSDEELEEDRHRFEREVGGEKKNVLEVQKSGGLWDVGGSNRQCVHKSQTVKAYQSSQRQLGAETGNGHTSKEQLLKMRDTPTERDSLKIPKSAGLALQQQGDGVDSGGRMTQRPPVEPKRAAHANGDPLSVFEDSTVSEGSEEDGRSAAMDNPIRKFCRPDEGEMVDDFDDLTQSSDTATEEVDSPTSGYRNASILIQQLHSSSIDSVTMVKLQNMFHEYERTIQRERGRYSLLADKVSQLEEERAELRRLLEETRDSRSALERRQVELDTDLSNLRFALKQEQEKHRNAAMLYDKSREQQRKKEEQLRAESEERQRVELAMRNLELEMRALVNNMKQLEEDRSEAQRMLSQERSARALQEGMLSSQLRKHKEIEEENRRNLSKSSEAVSQLSEASERERELLQQNRSLQEELERARAHSRQEEGRLSEESEALRERLEDAKRDLKLNEEALAQTVFQYNGQLAALKAECSVAAARLEHERQARERLEAEAESARVRLGSALQEAERSQALRAEAERTLQREREEWQRAQEKGRSEAAGQRESIHTLSQRLGKAESKANSLENECHRSTLALTEKTVLLEAVQRDCEQAQARVRELDAALLAEREQCSKAAARQEAVQERLARGQSENMLLRQQLEEAHCKGAVKERAVTDAQERFGDLLAKLRADSEERVHMVEERSKELVAKNAELREEVYRHEQERTEREATVRQLQQELADALKKLSMCEASLEVNSRYRSDLEEEKLRLQKDMDRLRGKLQESEDQCVQSERRVHSLKGALDDKEREVIASAQKLQEVLSVSAATETTIKQLEEAVQRLEIENARLEAAAKQQTNKIEVLQKGAQEAAATSESSPDGRVRNRLEDLVTDLQGAKINLEDQLNREVQKQSMLSHNAEGSHQLWEEELKTRSKLGLRLAELEKEKGELYSQMEIERKKAKKIAEQKKAVDQRLEQEMKRNTDLQKEMYRLRTLVKTAKKKLRDQDGGEQGSPLSSFRGERHLDMEASVSRMKARVDELSIQLEKEALKSSRLEAVNTELKEQLSSLKTLSKSHERLERSKRQLEEELSGLRRQVETSMLDQNQADQYRRETEERARQEIRHKLEEVNLFLQTQAASHEALEQLKAANEASLRSQLEQRIRDLEGELGRVRSSQQDSLSQRDSTHTELERYRQLYAEEMRLRKSLAAKLERSNERLAEANTRLLSERQRSKSFIASSIVNGGLPGPSLDVGQLGSVGAYGATLGPLSRSLGLGGSFLSPMAESQSGKVEAYLAKMQNELEKNISRELDDAAAELEGGSARLPPVGSAAGSQKNLDQDPVTRATQQYLEVLKKNYMI